MSETQTQMPVARSRHWHPGGGIAWGVAALLGICAPARAQLPDTSLWGVNNAITAVTRSGDKVYVVGSFIMAFPNTGGGVVVDRKQGAKRPGYPRVAGWVNAAVPDGDGGWFIGGAISGVGGHSRGGLAHIGRDGRLSGWNPDCDGQVFALARRNGVVYVGGEFARVGSAGRRHLAAIDEVTGSVRDWDPSPNGPVFAFLLRDTTLFVGGEFDSICGVGRMSLAAVSLESGTATAWDPNVSTAGSAGTVQALTALGDTLYLGGYFGHVGSQLRPYLGAVDMRTGEATEWMSNIATTGQRYDVAPYVAALAAGRGTVYVAGHFKTIGGVAREGLAELDAITGAVTAWDPQPGPALSFVSPFMTSLSVSDSTVYVAGNRQFWGGEERSYLAELNRTTAVATRWDPRAIYVPNVVSLAGSDVFIGGDFQSVGNEWQPRHDFAVFDARTGKLDDWGPIEHNGLGMDGVVVDRGVIYVGGDFTQMGGRTRWGLAAIDSATGRILDWAPSLNQPITRMRKHGDRLFICGNFTQVGDQPRSRLASFDLKTGVLDPWHPTPDHQVEDIAFGDGVIYAVGLFQHAGGLPRISAAAFDADSGATLPWDPHVDQYLDAIAVIDSTVLLGGPIGTASGAPRVGFAAVDARTGDVLPWAADVRINANRRGRVYALATAGDTVFLGGGFASVSGQPRSGLAALDARTGEVLDWDPQPRDATGDFPFTYSVLFGLTVHERTLYIGGRFAQVGPHAATSVAGIALGPALPTPPPEPPPTSLALRAIAPNPTRDGASITLALPTGGPVDLAVFDIQGRRVRQILRSQVLSAGVVQVPIDASTWREGVYFCRLEAGGQVATRRFTVLR